MMLTKSAFISGDGKLPGVPILLESIGVPPAALSRSKGGFDGALVPLEASGHGRRHCFWARIGSI